MTTPKQVAAAAVTLMFFTIQQIVKFHQDNVRIVTNDFPSMGYDIGENGLKDPPVINIGKDKTTTIKGHRRIGGILWLAEHEPELFKRAFPDGKIPCNAYEGLSDFEIVLLRNDHGNVRTLVKGEVLKSMGQLFGENYTERQVILANLSQLEQVAKPAAGKKGAEAIKMREEAASKKSPAVRAKMYKDSQDLSVKHFHGFAGTAKQIFLLRHTPAGPMALEQYCGLEVKVPLKLDHIQKLASKLVDDLKKSSTVDAKTKFGKTSLAYWKELVKKSKEPKPVKSEAEAKPDMLTRKQSEEREMLFQSQACKLGFKASRGLKVPNGQQIDEVAHLAEQAFACDPEGVKDYLESIIAEYAPTVTDEEAPVENAEAEVSA
jgi:hypothetical protein